MAQARVWTIPRTAADEDKVGQFTRLTLVEFMEMLARLGITAAPLAVQER